MATYRTKSYTELNQATEVRFNFFNISVFTIHNQRSKHLSFHKEHSSYNSQNDFSLNYDQKTAKMPLPQPYFI